LEPEPHRPTRGSDVEAWIKADRDRRPRTSPAYVTLDRLLDDYRLRADVGALLTDPRPSEGDG
jgi:hypothetical protein